MAVVYQINCGGGAASPFTADAFGTGAGTSSTGTAIDLSFAANPAPQAVYQSDRYGSPVTYTITGLTPLKAYTVRLHFAEIYVYTTPGQRVFDVTINGTTVLSSYDIIADVGAQMRAASKEFTATSNGSGQIIVAANGIVDQGKFNGIEILTITAPATKLAVQRRAPGFPPKAPIPGIARLGAGIL